jgi:hypothetical protein
MRYMPLGVSGTSGSVWNQVRDMRSLNRFTSPHHAPMPNHLPTLIVTPHGMFSSLSQVYCGCVERLACW